MQSNDYRASHLRKGQDYHAIFSMRPHTALLWRLEQRTLRQIIREYFPIEKPRYLDFACGTGRILEYCAPYAASTTGVDVSESMVKAAQARRVEAEFVIGDMTRSDVMPGRTFDLVTLFRFLANAEDELRRSGLSAIRSVLSPRGVLVLNNHRNADSYLNEALRRSGRDVGHVMSECEMEELLESTGFRILARHGLGVLPITDRYVRAPNALFRLECALSQVPRLSRHAQDQIFVAAANE